MVKKEIFKEQLHQGHRERLKQRCLEELMKVLQEVGQAAYTQTQSEAPASDQTQTDQGQAHEDDGDVVDGEFKSV